MSDLQPSHTLSLPFLLAACSKSRGSVYSSEDYLITRLKCKSLSMLYPTSPVTIIGIKWKLGARLCLLNC